MNTLQAVHIGSGKVVTMGEVTRINKGERELVITLIPNKDLDVLVVLEEIAHRQTRRKTQFFGSAEFVLRVTGDVVANQLLIEQSGLNTTITTRYKNTIECWEHGKEINFRVKIKTV